MYFFAGGMGRGVISGSLQYTTTPLSSAEASLYCGEAGEKEKESARGTIGRGKREETPALSLFPSSPVRFLFFRLLLILQGYLAGASAEERATTPLRPCGWLGTFSALVVWKAVIKSNYKQLLDEVFVISGIIKVEVSVISRSRRLRLITLTETVRYRLVNNLQVALFPRINRRLLANQKTDGDYNV